MPQEYQKENYEAVNGAWPKGDLPKPSAQEAISAVKRLYRLGMGKAYRGKFKATSGNRHTWPRSGVYAVNPDFRGRGWHSLVHAVSHLVHARRNPEFPPHDFRHAQIEKSMIEYVVHQGWLEGKLKREEKEKPHPVNKRYAAILAGTRRWESKARRAKNALKKLNRQKDYYERKGIVV